MKTLPFEEKRLATMASATGLLFSGFRKDIWLFLLSPSLFTLSNAQARGNTCISLSSSKLCPAFNTSYVSTSSSSEFPFLAFVSNTSQFDSKFEAFIRDEYVQKKYQNILGCSNLNLTNTSSLYARYTTSVLCNAMVQQASTECNPANAKLAPLCADTCAQFAISEQIIASDPQTCNTTRSDKTDQIRSDFTICALPADSLSGDCISGRNNEETNCGFGPNLPGLCLYCSSSSPNATDSCCFRTDLEKCSGVRLPPTTSLPPLFTSSASSAPTHSNTAGSASNNDGRVLSGGGIAGIIIGSLLIIALIILMALFFSRRRKIKSKHVFNQPSPRRSASQSHIPGAFNAVRGTSNGIQRHGGYEVLPSSRIARMSALETTNNASDTGTSPQSQMEHLGRGTALFNSSSSSNPHSAETPESNKQRAAFVHTTEGRPLQPPPRGTRNTSLSSGSALDNFSSSPSSDVGADVSSPTYDSSQQSEQLNSFKDYYSKDDVHPNDKVAVLWAYTPRAADEFELERGDVLKVVGIWDDGWATGIRMNERAEDSFPQQTTQDNHLSASQGTRLNRDKKESLPVNGEIKAFPLVCVCLPEHWQRIVDQENRTSQIVSMNINSAYDKPAESELQRFAPDSALPHDKESSSHQDNIHSEKR